MSEKIVQRNEEAIKGGFGNRRAAALPERHCNRNPTISSAAPPWHGTPRLLSGYCVTNGEPCNVSSSAYATKSFASLYHPQKNFKRSPVLILP